MLPRHALRWPCTLKHFYTRTKSGVSVTLHTLAYVTFSDFNSSRTSADLLPSDTVSISKRIILRPVDTHGLI